MEEDEEGEGKEEKSGRERRERKRTNCDLRPRWNSVYKTDSV